MARALTTKQFKRGVYTHLQKIKRELAKAGVQSVYKKYSLIHANPEMRLPLTGFHLSIRRINASNGEAAGLLQVQIVSPGGRVSEQELRPYDSFEPIKARLIELFAIRKD